ncbi:MAG: enoyl-CoA hydratase [Halioglobus sp.]
MTEQVLTVNQEGILQITLNRPEKKNALNAAMYNVMSDAIEGAEDDFSVRVLLITGCADSFTAGNDIADFLEISADMGTSPATRFLHAISRSSVPIVAAVNGLAVGVGTTMLLHCDQVLASSSAIFTLPFVNLGVVPEAASSLLLTRQAGYQRAAELLLLGEPFDAQTALEAGIVSRIHEDDTLLDAALTLSQKLAAKPRGALRASKQLLRRTSESVEERMEAELKVFAEYIQSPASVEIMTAFIERRKPDPAKID